MSWCCLAISWQMLIPIVRLRADVPLPNGAVVVRVEAVWPFRVGRHQSPGRRRSGRSSEAGERFRRALHRALEGLSRRRSRFTGWRDEQIRRWRRTWLDELGALRRIQRRAIEGPQRRRR